MEFTSDLIALLASFDEAPTPKSTIELIRELCLPAAATEVQPHQSCHFNGPFSGAGAQSEAAKTSNLVIQTNPGVISGKCYSYDSLEERDKHIATLIALGENVNERVLGPDQNIKGYSNAMPNLLIPVIGKARPAMFRFFMDLDDSAGLTSEEEFLSIYRAIMFTHKTQGYEVAAKLQIYGYDKPGGKKSRHVLTNFMCRSGLECKYFCKKIMKNIPSHLHKIVDCNLYNNSSFGLRLPGCMKKPGDKASILGDIYNCGLPKFASLIVGDFDQIEQLNPQYLWDDVYVSQNLERKLILDIENKSADVVPADDLALNEMFAYVRENLKCYDEPTPINNASKPHLLYNFQRLHSAYCELCCRTHDKMGAYLISSNGNLFLKCSRATSSQSLHKIITNHQPANYTTLVEVDKPVITSDEAQVFIEEPAPEAAAASDEEFFMNNEIDPETYDGNPADLEGEAVDVDDVWGDDDDSRIDHAYVARLKDAERYESIFTDIKIFRKAIADTQVFDYIARYYETLELNLKGALEIFEKYFTAKDKTTGKIVKYNRWCRIPETIGNPMGLRCEYDHENRFIGMLRHMTDFEVAAIEDAVIIDDDFYKIGDLTVSRWTQLNPPRTYEPDEFDQLLPASDVIQINSRYISDAVKFLPEEDHYISSPWNTGKTYIFQEFLKDLAPEAKVLFVTARKTLTAQMSSKLDISNYTSIAGDLNTSKTPKSIFQLESLKRVSSDEVFDYVIIDEIDALSGHCFQANNNIQSRSAMSVLRELIKNARSVIVSDNDLTSSFVSAVRSIRPSDVKANIYKNNYKSFAETSYSVISQNKDKKKPSEQLTEQIFKFCAANFDKMKSGQAFESCAVACHSRAIADQIYAEAVVRFGAANAVLYTSKTCDQRKNKDFKDATEAWANKLIIIYSPTVSIGISAEIKHLTTVFGIFNSETASATQSAQMLFRARFVKHIHIAHDKSFASDFYPEKPEFLYDWLTKPSNRKNIPDEFRHDRCPGITMNTAKCGEALDTFVNSHFESRMWLQSIIGVHRSRNNFVRHISRILESAGCKLSHPINYPASTEIHASGEKRPLTDAEMMSTYVTLENTIITRCRDQNIPQKDLELAQKFTDDDLRENNQPAEIKASLAAKFLRNQFCVSNEDMTPAFIEHYQPLSDKLKALGEVIRMQVANTNGYNYENKLDSNETKVPLIHTEKEATSCIHNLGIALGINFEHLDVLAPTKVSRDCIEAAYVKFGHDINTNALRLFGDRRGKFRLESSSKILSKLATLNMVLKNIGAKIVSNSNKKLKTAVQDYDIEFEYKSPSPLITTPDFDVVLKRYLYVDNNKITKPSAIIAEPAKVDRALDDLLALLM